MPDNHPPRAAWLKPTSDGDPADRQGLCAAMLRAQLNGDDDGIAELMLTLDTPVQTICALIGIAARLGTLAYGPDRFAYLLGQWEPGQHIGQPEHGWWPEP